MIVDFIKKKNEPFTNRHFYKRFFSEHEKAEKINALEKVASKLTSVLAHEDGEANKFFS